MRNSYLPTHPNVASFDNYVGKVSINGKEYYVRTTVQQEWSGQNGKLKNPEFQIVYLNKLLRTPQVTIYGWTDGKRIYLTREEKNTAFLRYYG